MNPVAQTPNNVCVRCGVELVHPFPNSRYCAACILLATRLDEQEQIGPYLIDSPLGEGGMGQVYLAFHQTTGRAVALKVPSAVGVRSHSSLLKRFAQEAHVLSLLDHPGILPIYEVGEDNDQPWFAMKLAEGGTLADRLAGGKAMDAREAVQILTVCASAVQYAHDHGILHRDLKPHNILLDENGHPMVGDFGLARVVSSAAEFSRSLVAFGTPGYSAPEISSGHAPSAAADVFSLGAILYHSLCGQLPFHSSSLTTILEHARLGRVKPLTEFGLSPDLWQICRKCLEPDPEDRYVSAADLEKDLQAWLEGKPVSVRPLSPVTRLSRIIRRHPLSTAMILTTSLAIIASLSLMLVSIKRVQMADAKQMAAEKQIIAEHLHLDHLNHIRLLLQMPRAGHRREALKLLQEEWNFRPGEALRSLAIQALAVGDLDLQGSTSEPDQVSYVKSPPPTQITSPISGRKAMVAGPTRRELHILNAVNSPKVILHFEDDILALQWNAAGDQLAIGCQDKNTYLWTDGETDAQLHIRNRESSTTHFAWHPTGRLIACRTEDGALHLWDLQRRQDLVMQRYGIPVDQAMSWDNNGQFLTWFDHNKPHQVRVELPKGVHFFRHHGIGGKRENFSTIDIDSDQGRFLWVTDEGAWLTDFTSGQQRLVASKDGSEWMGARFTSTGIVTCGWSSGLRTLTEQDLQNHKTLSADHRGSHFIGDVLLTTNISSEEEEWLALLERPSNAFYLIKAGFTKPNKTLAHPNPFAIALSRDNRFAATSSFQNTIVRIWDLQPSSLKPLHEINLSHTAAQLCFSPDGTKLATVGTQQLLVWSTTTAELLLPIQASEPFHQADWSPDGRILAVQTQTRTFLYRSRDGMLLAELTSPVSQPGNRHVSLAFDRKQSQLVEQLEDGSVILWDLAVIQHELEQLGIDWPVD